MAKAVFDGEVRRLLREYGAIRLAKLDAPKEFEEGDTLVLVSPIFKEEWTKPMAAAIVLDRRLYELGERTYGTIKAAAKSWGNFGSLHSEESEQEGALCVVATL